jgi:hypothetical protein
MSAAAGSSFPIAFPRLISGTLVLLAALSPACAEDSSESPLANEYAIYDAVLKDFALSHSPTGPFVIAAESSLPDYFRNERNVAYLRGHFAHLDPAIMDSLLSVNLRPARLDESRFTIPAIFVLPGKLLEIGRWEEFEQRFPGARFAVSVSNVAFNGERTIALVYWDYHCGGKCGKGSLTQLDLVDSRWTIQKTLMLWIS